MRHMRNQKMKKMLAGVVAISMALACLFIQPDKAENVSAQENGDKVSVAASAPPENTPGQTPENTPEPTPDNTGNSTVSTGGGINVQPEVLEVTLDKKSAYLIPGKSIQLKATVKPMEADQGIIWQASSTKYITLSQNGKVKAKKSKSAIGKKVTVTAVSAADGTKQASCKLTIVRKVKSITVTGKSLIKAGKSFKLKAKVKPSNATVKSVTWKSSRKKYATVNAKGKVKTKKSAARKSVIITATAKDGSGVSKKYYVWIY